MKNNNLITENRQLDRWWLVIYIYYLALEFINRIFQRKCLMYINDLFLVVFSQSALQRIFH